MTIPPPSDRAAEIERTLALLARIEAAMDRFAQARGFAEAARLAGWTEAEVAEAMRALPSLRGSGAPPGRGVGRGRPGGTAAGSRGPRGDK